MELATLAPRLPARAGSAQREAFDAALNGVMGDPLAASGNPLALLASLRSGGHSRGGRVSRSASAVAQRRQHAWLERQDSIVSLGTPHDGARWDAPAMPCRPRWA
jgi:triacylglycerol esterase/lipase EstA (alpha/beta hydrolase family)